MAPHHSYVASTAPHPRLELRFLPRDSNQRCVVFPCDAAGHVEIDRLSERERIDYLFARALRGRDYSPAIVNAWHD